VIGAVTLVMAESGRRYEEADVQVAEELARRIVIAIENARLYSAAQAAVQTRERILAVVSHDLRNQLGVLRMTSRLLALLARRGDTEAMLKSIETIDRAAGTMRRLVDDLLDMAALQAGRLSIIARDVDLKQIIDEACEPQVTVAREKGVMLECPVVESVQVHADPERILQVLGNLLGNALKFCEGGDSVRLAAETRPDDVLISVTDNGPGIPDGDVAQLFHPYRPLRRSERSGTGLGLYIAKGIVERHGGRIWVECKEGKGTTFHFTLPRAGRTALTAPEARGWQPR
jgi:signal transduction histidine kinase